MLNFTEKQIIYLMSLIDPMCKDCRVKLTRDRDGSLLVLGLMPDSEDVAFYACFGGLYQSLRVKKEFPEAAEYSPLSDGVTSFRLQKLFFLKTDYNEQDGWRVSSQTGETSVDQSLSKAIAKTVIMIKYGSIIPEMPGELK